MPYSAVTASMVPAISAAISQIQIDIFYFTKNKASLTRIPRGRTTPRGVGSAICKRKAAPSVYAVIFMPGFCRERTNTTPARGISPRVLDGLEVSWIRARRARKLSADQRCAEGRQSPSRRNQHGAPLNRGDAALLVILLERCYTRERKAQAALCRESCTSLLAHA